MGLDLPGRDLRLRGPVRQQFERRLNGRRVLAWLQRAVSPLAVSGGCRADVNSALNGTLLGDLPVLPNPAQLELRERQHEVQRQLARVRGEGDGRLDRGKSSRTSPGRITIESEELE